MGGHIFRGHLDHCQKPPHGGRLNSKPGDHGTPNAQNRCYILFYHVWGPTCIEIHWNSILVEGPVTYDFTVYSRVRDHTTWFRKRLNLWTLSFGLSQIHGHGSWLVRKVPIAVESTKNWDFPKSQVLSPKDDMDTYMATLFGGEAWKLCWELGQAQKKLDPTLWAQVLWTFVHKTTKIWLWW